MKPIEHIRKNVFNVSQAVFGGYAGTTQASVSRWEKGDQEPSQKEMAGIRQAALDQGLAWDDSWFFELPKSASASAEEASS